MTTMSAMRTASPVDHSGSHVTPAPSATSVTRTDEGRGVTIAWTMAVKMSAWMTRSKALGFGWEVSAW